MWLLCHFWWWVWDLHLDVWPFFDFKGLWKSLLLEWIRRICLPFGSVKLLFIMPSLLLSLKVFQSLCCSWALWHFGVSFSLQLGIFPFLVPIPGSRDKTSGFPYVCKIYIYYTVTCGSGDFTNIHHVWLKTFSGTAFIGVVLFQISNPDRENQIKPLIASLSKHTLSWAGSPRNLRWSPNDVMVR